MNANYTNKIWRNLQGFTLLELLITTGIFIIITGVIVAGYPKFRSQISVGKVVREMALATRQAQAFGLAVKQRRGEGPDAYAPDAYGVHFNSDSLNEMIVFADRDGGTKEIYDPGGGCGAADSECVERFKMRGVSIFDLCVSPDGLGNEACLTDGRLKQIDIAFRRADPDSKIYQDGDNSKSKAAAFIHIKSDRYPDRKKVMRVWLTGQISVQDD